MLCRRRRVTRKITVPRSTSANATGIGARLSAPVVARPPPGGVVGGAGTGPVGVTTVSVGGVIGSTPSGVAAPPVAVLVTLPEVTSAAVTVYGLSAVHVTEAPGASVVGSHVTGPAFGSSTDTPVSVTLPVLVSRNE